MSRVGAEFNLKKDILGLKQPGSRMDQDNPSPGVLGNVKRTMPGSQSDRQGPRPRPGVFQGDPRAMFNGKTKMVGPRSFNPFDKKEQSQEVAPGDEMMQAVGEGGSVDERPQNDWVDPGPDHPQPNSVMDPPKKPGSSPPLGPRSSALSGDVLGYRSGKKSKLDCGDESAQDFRNSPEGYKCCLKSAKCFENLPEDIDEVSEGTNETSELSAGNFADACGKIDDALVCMANVLGRDKCKSAAQIVNKDLSEELLMVDRFHKQHCSKTPGGPATISPNPNIPGGQGHISTSGSSSSLPTSAVIGAAIGGLFIIVLIIAIVCIARRKKSSRSQTQDKVAFHNPSSSDSSSRYKEFLRPSSEVYAEIDEKHLQRSFRVSNDTTFEKEEGSGGSTGSRPLPTAPSDGVYEDKAGYLTPKASRENLNNKTGYDELSNVSFTEESISGSYDKLARATADAEEEIVDGDYITPESEPAEERTIPDNHHTYFVLEK
uniref:Uncharacterized protein LOC111105810 isoform X3 n=1 Tax=Crassostrea virginica TaxID=6565 RepID=A0A8B8B002_CRAVI|nr:uncharacterized protein LOC111105810 isoform X3 [Crassostrea virginica]